MIIRRLIVHSLLVLHVVTANCLLGFVVEGICEGIPAGYVQVMIRAGVCKNTPQPGDCLFGWYSDAHFMISETYVDREIIDFT